MSLNPLNSNLGQLRAKHLLRRCLFHYNNDLLNNISNLNATEAVSQLLLDDSVTYSEPYDPLPDENPHGFWLSSGVYPPDIPNQGRKRGLLTAWWWYNMINRVNLKDKLTFFLHTTFTIANGDVGASHYFYDHLRLLEYYSSGNLRDLAKKITLDNAMLNYLDNTQNNANNPNENYAREFLELFTITKGEQVGEGDYSTYTEQDVIEAARVFSGFKTQLDRSIIDPDTNIPMGRLSINQHDQGIKTFSYAFDNYELQGGNTQETIFEELYEFVDMVFDKQATALAYVKKLYRFFVKSEWDEDVEQNIIIPLADDLYNNGYEILPVVKKLLESQHFFDAADSDPTDEIIGSIIKSPLQLLSSTITNLGFNIPDPENDMENYYKFVMFFMRNTYFPMAGMNVFAPDTVAGHPAIYQSPDFDRHWFSSSTILARYRLIECLITGRNKLGGNGFFGSELDTVAFVENTSANPGNIYYLVDEIANILYPNPIDQDRVDYFAELILEGYPSYYWTDTWDEYLSTGENTIVKTRLDLLIGAMINAPEYQLM
ncbi:MAG: DUF1800 family protein [Bacteroidota bacterium]|nr:DUF1800 family protein [Bacteroidota bacterium]MEC9108029.1 DUF1800 family protein [Bacteroidota bacterium]